MSGRYRSTGRCLRCRLRSSLSDVWVRSLRCSGGASGWSRACLARRQTGENGIPGGSVGRAMPSMPALPYARLARSCLGALAPVPSPWRSRNADPAVLRPTPAVRSGRRSMAEPPMDRETRPWQGGDVGRPPGGLIHRRTGATRGDGHSARCPEPPALWFLTDSHVVTAIKRRRARRPRIEGLSGATVGCGGDATASRTRNGACGAILESAGSEVGLEVR
jgi:hypothetical protein